MTRPPSIPTDDPLPRLKLFFYLVPVFGLLPALWGLYRRPSASRDERQVWRTVVALGILWLLGQTLLNGAGGEGEVAPVSLQLISSLLTSGYFAAHIWLMVQLWQRRPVRLPGLQALVRRLP